MATAKKVSGATLWIGTTADNAATDTYTQIGGVKSISMSGGGSYQMIDTTTIADTVKQTAKTVLDPFDTDLDIQEDRADAGQTLLRAAFADATDANYNFEVRYVQGDKHRFKAKVVQINAAVGAAAAIRMLKAKLEAQNVETYVAA